MNNVCFRGTVRSVEDGQLLVRNWESCQDVVVFYDGACRFSCGQCVRVHYNGIMTLSLPPQVNADCVEQISC